MSFTRNSTLANQLRERMLLPAMVVATITLVGTGGYFWLGRGQGATLLDALYMTIITITTIGYGEVIRLDEAGRLFTIFVSITGIGAMFYSMTTVMDVLVMSRIADPLGTRKMQSQIQHLRNHIIIAGLGRVGRQSARELKDSGVPFVIIDPRQEALMYATQHGYLIIQGDASEDEVLERAAIRNAKGLIVTSGDDASNLYIVLSARVLNPELYIVSRAVDDASVSKLTRAGANRAISPYAIGGRRLAHLILSPTVIDFFDSVLSRGEESLNLEGIQVRENSMMAGRSLGYLRDQDHSGANILVIRRGQQVIPNPDATLVLAPGDEVLALGTAHQLQGLVNLIALSQ
jgi:voltage-gated potassium channel